MKFNQWTLGLAAVGAISMASAVRADEAAPKLSQLNTAVSSTVISGYVDVAAQWNAGNPGKTTAANQPIGLSTGKVDGFNLNSVTISLDKPLDESQWASGYHIDLNWGTDAAAFGANGAGAPVRQAYVTMRTPVGNGIDWKLGAFDGVTGYEVNTGYANPNYTRSYGYQVNPASELGFIGSYKVCDIVAVQTGIAQRGMTFAGPFASSPALDQKSVGLSSKDYIATVALTAPESLGFLKGSVINLQTVQGLDNGAVNNYSVNGTFATPVAGLKLGLAYDKVQDLAAHVVDFNIFGVYATFQATDKLGFNLRGEYVDAPTKFEEVTATIQYDLWANVVSRLEVRWDRIESGVFYNNGSYLPAVPSVQNAFLVALNLVYKF